MFGGLKPSSLLEWPLKIARGIEDYLTTCIEGVMTLMHGQNSHKLCSQKNLYGPLIWVCNLPSAHTLYVPTLQWLQGRPSFEILYIKKTHTHTHTLNGHPYSNSLLEDLENLQGRATTLFKLIKTTV